MEVIRTEELTKTYMTRVKQQGLRASVRALGRPEYRTVEAVRGVSFSVKQGERLAFIGPNGAGKSTTIKMLTGILTPTSGSCRVLGLDPNAQRRALSRRIGTVFGQKSQLWFHLPPSDSFELLGAIYDIPKPDLKQRICELVDRFSLGGIMDVPVRKLSLGQRIRCEVAASLLHEPEILFLDEPTIGLDVVVKRQIRELIMQMNREKGVTIFLTSHDSTDIERLCQRAIVIGGGRIATDAGVDDLRRRYFSEKVISVKFASDPVLENLPGLTVEKHKDGGYKLRADTSRIEMDDVMRAITQAGTITDMTVEDPPMEQVIADIFGGVAK